MPAEHRFEDLDLREEPPAVAKLDDEYADAPTPTARPTYASCRATCTC